MEGISASPDAVGDNNGAARSMTEAEDETAEMMSQGSCGSREGGRTNWLGAGEEDAGVVSELNLLNNEFSSLALSRFPSI